MNPFPAVAQAPVADTPVVRVGALLQFTGDFENHRSVPGRNGFRVDNARVRISGALPGRMAFSIQTNHASLLEARITLPLVSRTRLDLGLFKPPLSAEFLQSTHSLDMLYRSQAVRTLIQGRDVGAQVTLDGEFLELRGGIFNGSGATSGNAEDGIHSTMRVELRHRGAGGDTLRMGGFVAANGDPAGIQGEGLDTRYLSLARLLGADLRWARGRAFGAAEWMWGEGDGEPGAGRPSGGHVTLGLRPTAGGEVAVRLDRVDPDVEDLQPSSLLMVSLGHRPTRELRLQVGAALPLTGPADGPRFLLRSQLYF